MEFDILKSVGNTLIIEILMMLHGFVVIISYLWDKNKVLLILNLVSINVACMCTTRLCFSMPQTISYKHLHVHDTFKRSEMFDRIFSITSSGNSNKHEFCSGWTIMMCWFVVNLLYAIVYLLKQPSQKIAVNTMGKPKTVKVVCGGKIRNSPYSKIHRFARAVWQKFSFISK